MKKIYLLTAISITLLIAACSKDFLKSYDKRIQGTWRLTDIDRFGFGSTNTQFTSGLFTFIDDGKLIYVSDGGDTSTGSWNIQRRWSQGNCYTDDNGNRNCNDRYIRSLSISVVNFSTQQFLSEYFDEINFTGTNRFNTQLYLGAGTCVFRFRRQ
jgi:hypothetical protein